jgi:hypothetical protein
VFAGFDITTGDLFFEFEMWKTVSREELLCFCQWLVSSQGPDRTVH